MLGSWYPTYPDRVDPTPGLHAAHQRPFFFDPEPIPTPDVPIAEQGWRGSAPDTIDRRPSMHAAPYFFFVGEPSDFPPAEFLDWAAAYPDQIARVEPHPSGMPSVFPTLDPQGFLPPDLSWEPELPTQVDRVETHASRMPSVFQTLAPELFPVDDLRWEPEYPDAVDRRTLPTADVPFYFAPERTPDAPFDPATLTWLPTLPAFARGPEPHAHRDPAVFFDPEPIPDVVPDVVPSVYPDLLHRVQPQAAVFVFEPINIGTELRVTQMPVEAVQVDDAIELRVTQLPVEVAQVDDTIETRLTQMPIEIVHTGDCPTFEPSVPPPAGLPPPCPPVAPIAVSSHDCPPTGTK